MQVNGELKCLGSANHLKSKYGQGFQLDLKTGDTKEHEQKVSGTAEQGRGVCRAVKPQILLHNVCCWHALHSFIRSDHAKPAAVVSRRSSGRGARRHVQVPFAGDQRPSSVQTLRVRLFLRSISPPSHVPLALIVAFLLSAVWRSRSIIESHRKQFDIIEYSVSPTTLEQVFIYFAKAQLEDERAAPA